MATKRVKEVKTKLSDARKVCTALRRKEITQPELVSKLRIIMEELENVLKVMEEDAKEPEEEKEEDDMDDDSDEEEGEEK